MLHCIGLPRPLARSLAALEAGAGQLYLSTFIATLIVVNPIGCERPLWGRSHNRLNG